MYKSKAICEDISVSNRFKSLTFWLESEYKLNLNCLMFLHTETTNKLKTDCSRFAIFAYLSEIITVLSQTNCMQLYLIAVSSPSWCRKSLSRQQLPASGCRPRLQSNHFESQVHCTPLQKLWTCWSPIAVFPALTVSLNNARGEILDLLPLNKNITVVLDSCMI